MLIKFKSISSPEVMMAHEHVERIMDLLQKSPTRGVITAAEASQALQLLEKEVALSKLHPEVDSEHASHMPNHGLPEEDGDAEKDVRAQVALHGYSRVTSIEALGMSNFTSFIPCIQMCISPPSV